MIAKGMAGLLAAAVLLLFAPEVAASERTGSIQVKLEAGDLAVTNGAVSLYQVGTGAEGGYRIREAFGGGIVRPEDAHSEYLAQWLAETAGETGDSMLLDADGQACFPGLEEGLYLLVQTERMDGFYPILPVLVTVPQEEVWDISLYREPVPVVTEIPKTGQTPVPAAGVLGMFLSGTGLLLCVKSRKH